MMIGQMRKNMTQHDWSAVAVDIVVVIVGILLAFQIERWGDDLRNHSLEQDYMVRLKQDLEAELVLMDRALVFAEERIQAAKFLNRAINNPLIVRDSPDAMPLALETATWRSYPQINAFVFGELQSSGNLALIRSESLRRNLTNHYTTLQHYSQVGLDLQAQHQFEQFTAGILTIDELTAVENNSWASESHITSVTRASESHNTSVTRAMEIVGDFIEKKDAIALLPSLVQHHTFNKKVIDESRNRAKGIIVQIDALLNP